MKTRFHITVLNSNRSGSSHSFYRAVDLPFAFQPGMTLEDATWHKPVTPRSISYSLDDGTIHVWLPVETVATDTDLQTHVGMYKAHGWKNILDE